MDAANTPSVNGTDCMLKSEADDELFHSIIDSTVDKNTFNAAEDEEENEEVLPQNTEINMNNVSEVLENVNVWENNSNDHNDESRDQFIDIAVTEANKIGEGMSAYVTYKVETKTNIGIFRKKSMSVHRRFSDFLGLHEKLVDKHLRSGRIIPPAPEKNALGTTRVKMSNSQADHSGGSTEFLEKRRASLERYLKRTAAHPILKIDPDFREFLESEGDLPKATSTSALSGAGVKRLFNKFGETVNKITYKMDESEPWFEEKSTLLDNIDLQLRKLHGCVEMLVFNRKDLAVSTSQFAKAAAMLSNCEEHTGLSRALSQLADVEEKIESVHNEQANSDFSILCELLKDYIALIGAVKEAFHERVKVYQHWQHSQMMLTKKREQKAKIELTGRTEKLEPASNEVIEWEAKVERCEEEFQKISKIIKSEFEQFEKNRVKEFKAVVTSYLEALAKHQVQVMKHWEAFLPEAKAIV
ncbi:sorting nexin-2 [Planococcus citri]|uniref:sorting nexin-2 n=1 Tax=Planococcus citri TaxID=170843 RepID=UPI0031F90FF9